MRVFFRPYRADIAPVRSLQERSGRIKNGLNALSSFPDPLNGVSVVLDANASTPSCTPAVVPAGLSDAGSGNADAINSYPKGAAAFADLRDGAHRLMKRRRRHGLG